MTDTSDSPGALAGATGEEIEKYWELLYTNAKRQAAARALTAALSNCDPEDRVLFLETILDKIRPGFPRSFNIAVMEEASWWADTATTPELKAYLLTCYRRLSAKDQAAFWDFVQGRAAA